MANPVGNELVTVQGVYNNQPAATTETYTLQQIMSFVPAVFGGGTATFLDEGNVLASIGNPVANPAGITNDYVLAVYTIPASSFSATGKGIQFTAAGNLGNDSQTKRVKMIFNPTAAVVGSIVSGGTTLGDTGSVTQANVGWILQSQVFKYGAAGSNTQIGQFEDGSVGTLNLGVGLASAITANESSSILLAVTGNATTSVGDISLYSFIVEAMN